MVAQPCEYIKNHKIVCFEVVLIYVNRISVKKQQLTKDDLEWEIPISLPFWLPDHFREPEPPQVIFPLTEQTQPLTVLLLPLPKALP